MTHPGEGAPNHPNPFEGVTLFENYDIPSFVAEEGVAGQTDWARVEVYSEGTARYSFRGENEDSPYHITQNLRNGFDFGSGLRDEVEARLARGRTMLEANGFDLNQFPEGYPEVGAILEAAQTRPVQRAGTLVPGNRYLYVRTDTRYGSERPIRRYYVFQHDRTDEPKQSTGTFVAVHYREDPALGKERGIVELWPRHGWQPKAPLTDLDGGVFGPNVVALTPAEETPHDVHGFYELSDDEIAIVGALREPNMEANIGSDFDHERLCVHAALSGLQYTRWLPYEQGIADDEESNRMYAAALTELVNRFGEARVSDEVRVIIENHLHGLHTQAHMPDSPYKPHSDGTPYGEEYMDVARAVTGNNHHIAENMRDSGHWVNFRSLFGDVGFWAVTRAQFPNIFNQAVDHLLGLPSDFQQKSIYLTHKVTINPVALIRDHYPDAYQEVIAARPDFVTDGSTAMRIVFTENELPRRISGYSHERRGDTYVYIAER